MPLMHLKSLKVKKVPSVWGSNLNLNLSTFERLNGFLLQRILDGWSGIIESPT
jgi:hypothetical protein